MKAVVIYEPKGTPRDTIMAVFPRHKVVVDAFAARGEVLGIGAFAGGAGGSMGIFRDRAAAEAFVAQDPRSCSNVWSRNTPSTTGPTH